jgi:transporter family protein
MLPILAGVFTAIAEILYLTMFSKGAPLGIGNPLVVGGTVVVAVLLGAFLLKDSITWVSELGIATIIIGIILLSRG